MKEEELKSLLDKSFSHLLKSLDKNNNSRFTIPLNEDGKPRISEHEMKLSFIETFLKCSEFKGYMYSVETPTQNVYRFTEKGKRQKPKCICEQNEKGRRGNIDVVVFVGEERVALIEFKANHAGSFEHAKDVCKLENEPGENVLRFLVEIFESTDDTSLKELEKKLYCNEYIDVFSKTIFVGYSLCHNATGQYEKFVGDNSEKKVLIGKFASCEK